MNIIFMFHFNFNQSSELCVRSIKISMSKLFRVYKCFCRPDGVTYIDERIKPWQDENTPTLIPDKRPGPKPWMDASGMFYLLF